MPPNKGETDHALTEGKGEEEGNNEKEPVEAEHGGNEKVSHNMQKQIAHLMEECMDGPDQTSFDFSFNSLPYVMTSTASPMSSKQGVMTDQSTDNVDKTILQAISNNMLDNTSPSPVTDAQVVRDPRIQSERDQLSSRGQISSRGGQSSDISYVLTNTFSPRSSIATPSGLELIDATVQQLICTAVDSFEESVSPGCDAKNLNTSNSERHKSVSDVGSSAPTQSAASNAPPPGPMSPTEPISAAVESILDRPLDACGTTEENTVGFSPSFAGPNYIGIDPQKSSLDAAKNDGLTIDPSSHYHEQEVPTSPRDFMLIEGCHGTGRSNTDPESSPSFNPTLMNTGSDFGNNASIRKEDSKTSKGTVDEKIGVNTEGETESKEKGHVGSIQQEEPQQFAAHDVKDTTPISATAQNGSHDDTQTVLEKKDKSSDTATVQEKQADLQYDPSLIVTGTRETFPNYSTIQNNNNNDEDLQNSISFIAPLKHDILSSTLSDNTVEMHQLDSSANISSQRSSQRTSLLSVLQRPGTSDSIKRPGTSGTNRTNSSSKRFSSGTPSSEITGYSQDSFEKQSNVYIQHFRNICGSSSSCTNYTQDTFLTPEPYTLHKAPLYPWSILSDKSSNYSADSYLPTWERNRSDSHHVLEELQQQPELLVEQHTPEPCDQKQKEGADLHGIAEQGKEKDEGANEESKGEEEYKYDTFEDDEYISQMWDGYIPGSSESQMDMMSFDSYNDSFVSCQNENGNNIWNLLSEDEECWEMIPSKKTFRDVIQSEKIPPPVLAWDALDDLKGLTSLKKKLHLESEEGDEVYDDNFSHYSSFSDNYNDDFDQDANDSNPYMYDCISSFEDEQSYLYDDFERDVSPFEYLLNDDFEIENVYGNINGSDDQYKEEHLGRDEYDSDMELDTFFQGENGQKKQEKGNNIYDYKIQDTDQYSRIQNFRENRALSDTEVLLNFFAGNLTPADEMTDDWNKLRRSDDDLVVEEIGEPSEAVAVVSQSQPLEASDDDKPLQDTIDFRAESSEVAFVGTEEPNGKTSGTPPKDLVTVAPEKVESEESVGKKSSSLKEESMQGEDSMRETIVARESLARKTSQLNDDPINIGTINSKDILSAEQTVRVCARESIGVPEDVAYTGTVVQDDGPRIDPIEESGQEVPAPTPIATGVQDAAEEAEVVPVVAAVPEQSDRPDSADSFSGVVAEVVSEITRVIADSPEWCLSPDSAGSPCQDGEPTLSSPEAVSPVPDKKIIIPSKKRIRTYC